MEDRYTRITLSFRMRRRFLRRMAMQCCCRIRAGRLAMGKNSARPFLRTGETRTIRTIWQWWIGPWRKGLLIRSGLALADGRMGGFRRTLLLGRAGGSRERFPGPARD